MVARAAASWIFGHRSPRYLGKQSRVTCRALPVINLQISIEFPDTPHPTP
ncbi:MAG: hypothetical protein F6J93_15780 [Oscillatoria sp. SIO1A7]|nr:hypothetical protein [Oscillatoria sp. SIO1A7]